MSSVLDRATEEEYVALVQAFPLLSIRDTTYLDSALEVLDKLLAKAHRTTGEEAYLSALTDLIETYENAHIPIPSISGVAALRYLMQENGLELADLGSVFDPKEIQELANTTAALVGRGVGDSSSVACAVGGDGASTTSEEFAQAGAAPATPDGRPAGEPRCTPVHLLHCSPDLASPPPNSIGYLLHPLCKFH